MKTLWISLIALLMTCCENRREKIIMQEKLPSATDKGIIVNGLVVNTGIFMKETVVFGNTVASSKTSILSSLPGKVSEIHIRDGDIACEGDTLAELENEHHSVLLQRAENELELATIELNSLLLGYGGRKGDSASVPPRIFRNITLQSGYVAAQENFRLAKHTVDRLTIQAPFTGMISDIDVTEGQNVSAGEHLFRLTGTAPLRVVFHISPQRVQSFSVGQAMSLEVPGTVNSDPCRGFVTSIGPSTNEDGFPRIKGVVTGPCDGLFDGSFVKVSLITECHDQLVVPKEALLLRDGRTIVFRYKQGRAVWTEVHVSEQNSHQYLISAGIKAGDTVLISGNIELIHGIPVTLARLTSKR